ncbi:MAG TPA: O-antigen ligase family protein [Phycisphaerales bacterium]|nr:O-antigen ligase family protein [Phycisphaerales bacterium]
MNAPARGHAGSALRRTGLVCILVAACARVVASHDPLPGWGLDPVSAAAPLDGIGPAGDMLLSVLSCIGLALVLAGAARAAEKIPTAALVLGALALPAIAYHGWLAPDRSVENAHIGTVWAGAIAGGLGALVACRRPAERALAAGVCAAIAGPLVFRAALQVYSEHPVLVEDFKIRREEILAGHGWSPGSAMARSYERRLSQPDASAWFAMANVYASVLAGCLAVFAGGVAEGVRSRLWFTGSRNDGWRMAGLLLGLVLSGGGLVLAVPAGGAPSKGAIAAAALGLALFALGAARTKLPRGLGPFARAEVIGVGVVAIALAAILLRGVLGERIGELSLLFRWYYAQAATRIVVEHPAWGVGPADFQAAYLLAKNPLNPEEVASPHSVMFEYLSTLGVFGASWCLLLLGMAALAGRSLARGDGPPAREGEHGPGRGEYLCLLAVIAPCAAVSFATEGLPLARSVADAFALLAFDGLVKVAAWTLLWFGCAAALLGVARSRLLAAGLGAGALAVLAHSQIELTATDLGSAGWAMVLLGAAGASPGEHRATGRAAALGAGAAGLCALGAAAAFLPVRAWQAELRSAARSVAESTLLEQRYLALARGSTEESPAALVQDLSAAIGRPVPPTPEGAGAALAELRRDRIGAAGATLGGLAKRPAVPSRDVAHAAVRLLATEAAFAQRSGLPPEGPMRGAAELATWATERWPRDSRAWRDLAQVRVALAEAGLGDAGDDLEALRTASALDPYSPDLAYRLAVRSAALGRTADARDFAARAVRNHEYRRLDPLAGLSDVQLQTLRELLGVP